MSDRHEPCRWCKGATSIFRPDRLCQLPCSHCNGTGLENWDYIYRRDTNKNRPGSAAGRLAEREGE